MSVGDLSEAREGEGHEHFCQSDAICINFLLPRACGQSEMFASALARSPHWSFEARTPLLDSLFTQARLLLRLGRESRLSEIEVEEAKSLAQRGELLRRSAHRPPAPAGASARAGGSRVLREKRPPRASQIPFPGRRSVLAAWERLPRARKKHAAPEISRRKRHLWPSERARGRRNINYSCGEERWLVMCGRTDV